MSEIVKRLQAPAYWMSGSDEGHEGENDAPREAADTITRLTAEVAEYKSLFDAAWEADMRGVRMWREAHPGNDMVLPDRANFTSWILAEIMQLRSLTVVQESLIRKVEAESEKLRAAIERALRQLADGNRVLATGTLADVLSGDKP
jgi:hypothetical protein